MSMCQADGFEGFPAHHLLQSELCAILVREARMRAMPSLHCSLTLLTSSASEKFPNLSILSLWNYTFAIFFLSYINHQDVCKSHQAKLNFMLPCRRALILYLRLCKPWVISCLRWDWVSPARERKDSALSLGESCSAFAELCLSPL